MISMSVGNAFCQKPEGLTKSEATEVFNLVDKLEYENKVLKIEAAYQDTLHKVELEAINKYNAEIIKEMKADNRKQLLYVGVVVITAVGSVWLGATAVK